MSRFSMNRRGCRLAICFATLLLLSPAAFGQTYTWNSPNGDYFTAGNWTPAGPPTAGSNVFINNGGTSRVTTGLSTPNSLNIGSTAGGSGTLAMTGGSIYADGGVKIGELGTGVATVTNAYLNTGDGSLFVGGQGGTGTGTLTVAGNDSRVSSTDDFVIGRVGTGTFNMTGGYGTADYTVIGKFGSGTWNQSGGLFEQTSGDFEIADGGDSGQAGTAGPRSGTMNLTGGVIQGSGFLAISNRRGTGAVNVSGGALALTGVVNNGAIIVGRGMDWAGSPGTGGPTSFRVTGGDSIIIANGAFEMNVNNVAISSTLIAEITGTQHTTIKVAGDANIGNGSFKVELNGYTPVGGERWTILSAGVTDMSAEQAAIDAMLTPMGQEALVHAAPGAIGTLKGQFKGTDFSLASLTSGLSWDVEYVDNSVVLKVAFDSDFTNDGRVDRNDLLAWKLAFGQGAGADANGDGRTDGDDFLVWQRQFGSGVPAAPAVGAVPEPASFALVGMALGGFALRRRARRAHR